METNIRQEYEKWRAEAVDDPDVAAELLEIQKDEDALKDAFYRKLAFGTGGLRGVIGAGTNRMNIYTVGQASQGLAEYLLKETDAPSVVIGYDSRIKSELFARRAAEVFAANGLKVFFWSELNPVPTVSWAVRYLHASAGVMITASHNPAKYNGYKVYGADGCQIAPEAAVKIQKEILAQDLFDDVKRMSFECALLEGKLFYIEETVLEAYLEEVKRQSVLYGDCAKKDVAIVYTPLNGAGCRPVQRILRETGYQNVCVVKEQEAPDGNFPTCPYPNPEISEAMQLGIEYAKREHADLLLATDPDCDRVGIAVKNTQGDYELLSGNETGVLLFDYICSQRIKHGKMPEHPVLVKTIVTTDMAERIAAHYEVRVINVLTGFKFIGEQIGLLEQQGEEASYVFGFEESYGYLSGTYVRDKDGVNAAYLICEMFSYYAAQGISLLDKKKELSEKYGYWKNTLQSYELEGAEGLERMQQIMKHLRNDADSFLEKKVVKVLDYAAGLDGLPQADVLKFYLEDGSSVVIRPSGTEPKLKVYSSVCTEMEAEA